jgi:hypothetical protein
VPVRMVVPAGLQPLGHDPSRSGDPHDRADPARPAASSSRSSTSGMTQTVLGSNLQGGGPNGGSNGSVTLSTSDPQRSGSEPHTLTYALPVSIPPVPADHLDLPRMRVQAGHRGHRFG